ncbi:MAG: flagellar hook-associated protein 3 FlgL [Paracoccaceae bacterium]|jgi:flagellar hook-associated protein 3 FlgL
MNRVANLGQHTRIVSLIMQTQRESADAELSIASGRKSQDYKGIARDASRLVELETTQLRSNQYVENNQLVEDRLQLMEGNVGQVFEILSDFKSLLINALNEGNATELGLQNHATEMMTQVATLLNADLDGRKLFAGSMTNIDPVDLTGLPVAYVIPTTDGDASGYYQGDAIQHTIRADDNLDLTYGITADALGFEQVIRAMDVVIKGAPTDTVMLNHALDITNSAAQGVADLRTQIGNTRSSLAEIEKTHQDFMLFASETIGDLENTDITFAITKLNETQTTLEASYMTLSRLGQISLLQFLR